MDVAHEVNACTATLAELLMVSPTCTEAQSRADVVVKSDPHCKVAYPDGKVDLCKLVTK